MRTPLLALCGALVVGLVACDAAAPASNNATAAALDVRGVDSADILYDIGPLAVGETFVSALDTQDGDAYTIRALRQTDGYAVSFEPVATAERVRVTYLYEGEPVAASFEVDDPSVIEAGVAEDEPQSKHVRRHNNGDISVHFDFVLDPTGPVIDGPSVNEGGTLNTGSMFTTPAGERVAVTHIQFDVVGGPAPEPTAIRFEAPRGIELTTTDLKRR